MPLQNRIDPFGTIFATEHRGDLMGNRGRLHDANKAIVRPWNGKAWITCALAFNGRKRELMSPDSYTELFFLDEATALAAGHRPCAECRRADYNRFKAAFTQAQAAQGVDVHGAGDVDGVLHRERRATRRTGQAAALPDGVMLALDDQAWLKVDDALRLWTPAGYTASRPLPAFELEVLTPASTVVALQAGYVVQLHRSARTAGGQPAP